MVVGVAADAGATSASWVVPAAAAWVERPDSDVVVEPSAAVASSPWAASRVADAVVVVAASTDSVAGSEMNQKFLISHIFTRKSNC